MLQAQTMRVINEALATIWQQMEAGQVEDDVSLGIAVNAQVNLNRIVYALNKRDQAQLKAEAWEEDMKEDAKRYLMEGGEA